MESLGSGSRVTSQSPMCTNPKHMGSKAQNPCEYGRNARNRFTFRMNGIGTLRGVADSSIILWSQCTLSGLGAGATTAPDQIDEAGRKNR
ncbi:unnamed protein product, partial [Nesidiocoris tenuis]